MSYGEKANLNNTWCGTQERRVGTDSQIPFGYCCLSLQPVVEPVVSPTGHLYSRECILEYLLTKKEELGRQKIAYEAQNKKLAEEAHAGSTEVQNMNKFIEDQSALGGAGFSLKRKRKAEEIEAEARKKTIERMSDKVDRTSIEQQKKDIRRSSWWVPEFTPDGQAELIPKPDKRPASPMSGRPLKLKNLVSVNFTMDHEKKGGPGGEKGSFICAVSKKELVHQPVVVFKKTGHAILKKVAEQLAFPTMTCPITGAKFKDGDVIHMAGAGSGFAAGGAKTASSYKAPMQ